MPLCAVRCCYFRVKIAPRPWGLATMNLQRLSGKVSPAHVFIHLTCQTKKVTRPAPLTKPNLANETADKKRVKKRWIKHSNGLKVTQNQLTPSLPSGRRLWERSPSYSVYRSRLSSLIWGSHHSPSSHFLNDNPLHSSLRSYHNQLNLWPWILQDPLTPRVVATGVENAVIHLYFMRVSGI